MVQFGVWEKWSLNQTEPNFSITSLEVFVVGEKVIVWASTLNDEGTNRHRTRSAGQSPRYQQRNMLCMRSCVMLEVVEFRKVHMRGTH